MNDEIQKSNEDILVDLLSGNHVSKKDHIDLKEALKKLFFYNNGFMSWARDIKRNELKQVIAQYKQTLLSDETLSPDDIVDKFATLANEYNQGWQLELFYELYELLLDYDGDGLEPEAKSLLAIIQQALCADDESRSRAITLVALFGEISNGQSRKSSAGIAAEDAIELVLRSIGLVEGETYGTQFKHYKGSDTDFVVPFNKNDSVHDIKAYIAVQSSTNDRMRLSSSELQDSGKRYVCSLNGCVASSKTTKDIGNALIGGQIDHDTYYVVIETERAAAIKEAEDLILKAKISGRTEPTHLKSRLQWLQNYAINYNQFADQLTDIMIRKMFE